LEEESGTKQNFRRLLESRVCANFRRIFLPA
jgi:hypothetical protein